MFAEGTFNYIFVGLLLLVLVSLLLSVRQYTVAYLYTEKNVFYKDSTFDRFARIYDKIVSGLFCIWAIYASVYILKLF